MFAGKKLLLRNESIEAYLGKPTFDFASKKLWLRIQVVLTKGLENEIGSSDCWKWQNSLNGVDIKIEGEEHCQLLYSFHYKNQIKF